MSTEALRTIGEALTFWREAAESMERQRNEAFQQVAAAESLAAALRSDVQDLTAERDALRSELAGYRAEVAPLLAEREQLLGLMANINRVMQLGGTITLRPKASLMGGWSDKGAGR